MQHYRDHAGALEILPVTLLGEHRQTVSRLRRLAAELRIGLGWHYLLDLSWIIAHLGPTPRTVLDAGAGWGLMQWYLCEEGFRVISADRVSRADLSVRLRARYPVRGLRPIDLSTASAAVFGQLGKDRYRPRAVARQLRDLAGSLRQPRRAGVGEVVIYNQELSDLRDIPSESVEAVVGVSALEHNQPAELEVVIRELRRVLQPGGMLIATLGAARDRDWFHEPSHGWCYTESTLRRIFDIGPEVPSNYDQYDRLLGELRGCAELRDNLAPFYFKSGDNGMPWGVWDPQYQSVGVVVTK